MTCGGHAYGALSDAELDQAVSDEARCLAVSAAGLDAHGTTCAALSAGTAPTSHRPLAGSPITELRPGNYVFYDATQVAPGSSDLSDALSASRRPSWGGLR